jgi:pantetheine-phosphate adenylyltransferase
MRTAVLPGSFDPITLGHLDVVRRAAMLFDRVVVAVLVNPSKAPLSGLEDRVAMVRDATAEMAGVDVEAFDGLLVEFAARCGARAVVRGLRSGADFDYEWPMARMNRALSPGLDTVYLAAAGEWAHVSSSLVREIHRLGGAIDAFVPPAVVARLAQAPRMR